MSIKVWYNGSYIDQAPWEAALEGAERLLRLNDPYQTISLRDEENDKYAMFVKHANGKIQQIADCKFSEITKEKEPA